MHPYLLNVPNTLYYDNAIKSGYKKSYQNKFLSNDTPLLFINLESDEKRYGTSFLNELEAETAIKIL